MTKYRIEYRGTTSMTGEVEANTKEEAEEIAQDNQYEGFSTEDEGLELVSIEELLETVKHE